MLKSKLRLTGVGVLFLIGACGGNGPVDTSENKIDLNTVSANLDNGAPLDQEKIIESEKLAGFGQVTCDPACYLTPTQANKLRYRLTKTEPQEMQRAGDGEIDLAPFDGEYIEFRYIERDDPSENDDGPWFWGVDDTSLEKADIRMKAT